MKKHFILAALAMTALFSACSNEEENLMTTGNEVNFVIGGVESRTITDATTFETTFSDNDKVGIFSTNLASDNNMSNTSFTVSGTALNLTEGENTYTFKGNEEATFNAYYPLQEAENVNSTTVTFSINAAQNEQENFYNSDFLTAVASAATGQVELNFNHRLALVQVTFTGLDNISTVTINSVKPTVTYSATGTTEQGSVTTDDEAEATNVTMYKPNDETATYWAIIPAQAINGALFTVITDDAKSYSYTPTSAASFTAGNLTKYSLTLQSTGDEDGQELTSFSIVEIVKWGNTETDAITGTITENKLSLTNDILFSKNITTTTGGFALTEDNNTEAKWVYQNATATIEEETGAEDESTYKYIKLVTAATAGSWYNEGVAYLGGETTINTSSTYTLTFDLKGTNTESQIQIYTVFKVGSTNYVYREQDWADESIKSGHSTRSVKPKTEWETISFNVDPAYYYTGASTSKTLSETPHANSKFAIAFNITSTGRQENNEFHIRNISFVEN